MVRGGGCAGVLADGIKRVGGRWYGFHVSAAEIDEQDTHQIIVIGIAAIVPHNAMADSLMDEISVFVEENTEAEILDEQREIR